MSSILTDRPAPVPQRSARAADPRPRRAPEHAPAGGQAATRSLVLPPGGLPGVPVTGVTPGGGAALSPADLLTVLDALADAAVLRQERGGARCLDCCAHPAGACDSHLDELDQAAAYQAAAARLGDYR